MLLIVVLENAINLGCIRSYSGFDVIKSCVFTFKFLHSVCHINLFLKSVYFFHFILVYLCPITEHLLVIIIPFTHDTMCHIKSILH